MQSSFGEKSVGGGSGYTQKYDQKIKSDKDTIINNTKRNRICTHKRQFGG